jgi:hypothetical protein
VRQVKWVGEERGGKERRRRPKLEYENYIEK